MNVLQQNTLHQLLGHSNLEDTGVDELFQLTDSHPFFSVSHFFLTKKLKEEKHPAYINQLQKTALFFSNPYWLHYQLSPITQQIKVLNKEVADMVTEPLLKNVIEEEIAKILENSTEIVEEQFEQEEIKIAPIFNDPIVHVKFDEEDEIISSSTTIAEEVVQQPVVEAETIIANDVEIIETKQNIDFAIPPTELVQPTVEVVSSASITSFALEAAEDEIEEIITEQKIIEHIVEVPIAIETTNEVDIVTNQINNTIQDSIDDEVTDDSEFTETSLPDNKITSILKEQLEEFKKPITDDAVLTIESEPYHTVDYFASQGIRPEIDHLAQDSLSKQLRRFTDWLKHMKNVPPSNEDLGTDPELENAIQGIAQISNEAKEIVTETMAEVLVKQGKTDKAIQLYIKLSFLNPEKSAYFASKIQILKGI